VNREGKVREWTDTAGPILPSPAPKGSSLAKFFALPNFDCTNPGEPVLSFSRTVSPDLPIDINSKQSIQEQEKEEPMRVYSNFGKVVMLATALLMLSFTLSFAKPHVEYKFKIHNNTKVAIKKIQVSDDGKKWGVFDIGDGIAAGATEEMVWDKSTDNGACEWWFKATWSDGEVSEAAKFDFCEKDLVIEFSK